MTIAKHINLLERLDDLIRKKATGTPDDLAKRLNVSTRTVYNYLHDMRSMGAPVAYDYRLQTYYYETDNNVIKERVKFSF